MIDRVSVSARSGVALAGILLLVACTTLQHSENASARSTGHAPLAELKLLDDRHSSEFRQAFDDARDQPRYVVALSPT